MNLSEAKALAAAAVAPHLADRSPVEEAGKKSRAYHGRAVDPVTREVKFLSVSALERADMSTHQGCLRKWWYNYIAQKKEPESKSTLRGNKLHAETAAYLRTGVKALSAQVIRGLHLIPEPGSDLFVEQPLVPLNAAGKEDLSLAILRAAGIPVIGNIDLMHERGTNKGGMDVEDTRDPPGTAELIDWKFPGKLEHAKKGSELPRLIQMAGYATWLFAVAPAVHQIRLSHGIIPVQGAPIKATIRVDRDAVRAGWEHAGGVARSIVDAARETNPDKVEANTRACQAYKKDCVHKPYCRAGMHNSLASILGVTAADNLFQIRTPPREDKNMALLPNPGFAQGNPAFTQQPTPQQQQVAPQGSALSMLRPQAPIAPGVTMPIGQPQAQIALAPQPAQVSSAVAQLQAEEAAARAQQQVPAVAQVVVPPGLLDACAQIQVMGRGFPTLSGLAAQACALAGGQQVVADMVYPGLLELQSINISDPQQIFQLLSQLRAQAQPQAPAASPPIQQGGGLLAVDAPPSNPALATSGPPQESAVPTVAQGGPLASVTAEPAKRKRRSKAEIEAEKAAIAAAQQQAPNTAGQLVQSVGQAAVPAAQYIDQQQGSAVSGLSQVPAQQAAIQVASVPAQQIHGNTFNGAAPSAVGPAVHFYVNCITIGVAVERFEPVVAMINRGLSEEAGAPDIRCAPQEGRLGFGRWKGAVAAALREKIAPQIGPGCYALDILGSEIAEVVADTMREVCLERGWAWTRGTR